MPTRLPAKRLDKPARLSPHRCCPLTPLSEEPSQSTSHPRPDPARTGPDRVIPSPAPHVRPSPPPHRRLPHLSPSVAQIPRSVSACKLQNTSIAPDRDRCIYIENVNTERRAGVFGQGPARDPVPAGREQGGKRPGGHRTGQRTGRAGGALPSRPAARLAQWAGTGDGQAGPVFSAPGGRWGGRGAPETPADALYQVGFRAQAR